jgi:hypothetical protein
MIDWHKVINDWEGHIEEPNYDKIVLQIIMAKEGDTKDKESDEIRKDFPPSYRGNYLLLRLFW